MKMVISYISVKFFNGLRDGKWTLYNIGTTGIFEKCKFVSNDGGLNN